MLTPHEKISILAQIIKLYEWTEAQPTTTPCNLCLYHSLGNCRAWDNEKIPKEVLPKGCEKWEFNINSAPF